MHHVTSRLQEVYAFLNGSILRHVILCIVSGLMTSLAQSLSRLRLRSWWKHFHIKGTHRHTLFLLRGLVLNSANRLFHFVSSKSTPITDVARNYSGKVTVFYVTCQVNQKILFCANKNFLILSKLLFIRVRKCLWLVVLGVRWRAKLTRNAATQKLAARKCTKYKTPLASINAVSTAERYLSGS